MKFKTTNKQVKEHYNYIIQASDLRLLDYIEPLMYNAGVYGWNYDLYDFNGVALIRSYRNTPCNILPTRKLIEKYNKKIEAYKSKYYFSNYTKVKNYALKLLQKFIEEVLE